VSTTGALVLKASSFELERNQAEDVSGSFEVRDADEITYEALMNLCSQPNVDKIVIVYRDYGFCLMGVSLHGENKSPHTISLQRRNFKFNAKDIRLEMTSK
jgi:hypothetical protein